MSVPLVSIVIANYNYGRFLDEAIRSVLDQSCPDWELIICDGGSTDNSKEVIEKYAEKIAWWCSEKDQGQSDAFNKGFAHAKGKFLTWLNADDVMLPGVVEKLKSAAERHPECEWFVGGSFWCDPEMKILKCNVARPFSEMRYRSGIVNVCGPSSFFTKRLLDAVGGVDVRFYYTMDMKLWFQFRHECGVKYRTFIDFAWGLRMHPDAKTSGHCIADGKADPVYEALHGELSEHHRKQAAWEDKEMMGDFPVKKFTKMRRILSIWWPTALKGLWLDWRWRGKHYLEAYR